MPDLLRAQLDRSALSKLGFPFSTPLVTLLSPRTEQIREFSLDQFKSEATIFGEPVWPQRVQPRA
jgi:hypothetical protein